MRMRTQAVAVLAQHQRIDVVINNAGVTGVSKLTQDGFVTDAQVKPSSASIAQLVATVGRRQPYCQRGFCQWLRGSDIGRATLRSPQPLHQRDLIMDTK
jgi:hypothetical protein